MNQKREYAFDYLRIVSMIMVIIVHVSNVYSRSFGVISNKSFLISLGFNTISRISVPIFLMISGALLLDRSFNKTKYWKRIIKYLILIVSWDIIYLVWEYLYLGITYNQLYRLLVNPYRAHLWFLYTILVLYILQPVLKWIMDHANKQTKIVLFIIWILFSILSITNSFIANTFTIFSYIGYFILGKHVYQWAKEKDLKKYTGIMIITIIICCMMSIILNYLFSIKYNRFYNLFFAYRTPFIFIASVSFYVMMISNIKKEKISPIVNLLSSSSLGVYLIHGIFLDITIQSFYYQRVNSLIGIPLFSIIILICSVLVVWLLRKIKIIKGIIE